MSAGRAGLVVRWKEQAPDDVTKELTQRSHFNSERVGLVEALVREAFQNILDAAASERTGPIRTRIAIRPSEAGGPPFMDGLLMDLGPHLRASGIEHTEEQLVRPGFLVIEDFNTTGLTGAWQDPGPGGWNDFFRAFGASHKGGRTGGRWGLGKLVFTSSSAIRTFFALTVRAGDDPPSPLLMGQTILKTHEFGGRRFGSHGFICLPGAEGTIQLPATDPHVIERFTREVGANRRREPGLTIAVAAPIGDLKRDEIVRFLLENYFFAIIDGQLEVDVDGVAVTASTFDDVVQRFGGESMKGGRLAAFIRDIGLQRKQGPSAIAGPGWPAQPDLGLSAESLEALRHAYREGELVQVRFPITLRDRTGATHGTYVDVMARKAKPGEAGGTLVVRGLLTIPGEADRIRTAGCFAALLAEDEAIASFLGDAEGPAHVDWNSRAERLAEGWRNPEARLREVRRAPRMLLDALSPAIIEEDLRALIDELAVDAQAPGAPDPVRPTKSPPSRPIDGEPHAPKRKFRLERRDGGFSVIAGPGLGEDDLPMRLRVRVAFDVPRGDPFKQHHRFDFDLTNDGEIAVKAEGAAVERENAQTAIVTAQASDFRATFEGFDRHRDLVVDVRRSAGP